MDLIPDYELNSILQIDETLVHFDIVGVKTLDFVGSKSKELLSTGPDKNRFTITLTISSSGEILPDHVLLRGLKKSSSLRDTRKCQGDRK